jgi:hypothetical protein
MALERIIVGDDEIEFAKKNMPSIPHAEIDFVRTPDELVAKVAGDDCYQLIISDYNYHAEKNGIDLFRELRAKGLGATSRRILWTGDASDAQLRADAHALGVDVLDKDELGTIVGLSVSKAPIKQDGNVLIYAPQLTSPVGRSLKQVVEAVFNPEIVRISDQLKPELLSGKYGLVIDTSTLGKKTGSSGVVAHDLKYLQLSEVPRVTCAYEAGTVIGDIRRLVLNYKH